MPLAPNTAAIASRLQELLIESQLDPLDPETADRFSAYTGLLLRWNARTNLSAIRDLEGMLTRHMVESIACARLLPAEIKSVLDFGSGPGLPGIPIALCRPELFVTLAESQGKKVAFLREAVRTLGIDIQIHGDRAETLSKSFDCVTLRAVDRMPRAIAAAIELIDSGGWLALLSSEIQIDQLRSTESKGMIWAPNRLLPGSERRMLALAQKRV